MESNHYLLQQHGFQDRFVTLTLSSLAVSTRIELDAFTHNLFSKQLSFQMTLLTFGGCWWNWTNDALWEQIYSLL